MASELTDVKHNEFSTEAGVSQSTAEVKIESESYNYDDIDKTNRQLQFHTDENPCLA